MMFVVQGWNSASEATYFFGPFNTMEQAEEFEAMISQMYSNVDILLVNDPSLAGTGQALSLE
jgi:hypothetical protein